MRLRGVDYGPCWDQSGVRNFFGDGYWYHRPGRAIGLRLDAATFVAKTTTLHANAGNMPLLPDGTTPKEWIPACIRVDPLRSAVLNSVGLSGPGAAFLLDTGVWQEIRRPFAVSFMAVSKTRRERLDEIEQFTEVMRRRLPDFKVRPALQMNFSCPNVGLAHEHQDLVSEVLDALDAAAVLDVPLIPKFNLLFPVESAIAVSRHPHCDAICMANSLPWGSLPDQVDWNGLFRSGGKSPLAHLGGGGLSGAPLLPLVTAWVGEASATGRVKPIIAGGGILQPSDVRRLAGVGASAVAVGCVSMLRPHRVRQIVEEAHRAQANGEFAYS